MIAQLNVRHGMKNLTHIRKRFRATLAGDSLRSLLAFLTEHRFVIVLVVVVVVVVVVLVVVGRLLVAGPKVIYKVT